MEESCGLAFFLRTGDVQLQPVSLGLILAKRTIILPLYVSLTLRGIGVEGDIVREQ